MGKNNRYNIRGHTVVKHTRKKRKNPSTEYWEKEMYSPPIFIGKQPPKEDKRSYKEKLKDPNWRKRREEIFRRDNFQCQKCGSRLNIQVHHKKYNYKKHPWEYPDIDLITLCGYCHRKEHKK